MTGENKPALVALRSRRDEVIEALTKHFSEDTLDLEEFEHRITEAHRAADLATLDGLVKDLEPLSAPAASTALAGPAPAPLEVSRPDKKTFVAVMSGVERGGVWRPPKRSRLVAIMGGAELDFREALLPPGVTEVRIYALMGGAEVIVPPNLAVECDGWGIMGGFEVMDRAPVVPDPNQPLLRITGFAMMGGFSIETRLPGESRRQAKRRRRKERRALGTASRKQLTK
ncbi:MAG TPA: DUF1707 domain-containing protein [Kofleriaceae bacterium]|nr:DUF1707 domain-containing protein [Kofleriaceae bacterium]